MNRWTCRQVDLAQDVMYLAFHELSPKGVPEGSPLKGLHVSPVHEPHSLQSLCIPFPGQVLW